SLERQPQLQWRHLQGQRHPGRHRRADAERLRRHLLQVNAVRPRLTADDGLPQDRLAGPAQQLRGAFSCRYSAGTAVRAPARALPNTTRANASTPTRVMIDPVATTGSIAA